MQRYDFDSYGFRLSINNMDYYVTAEYRIAVVTPDFRGAAVWWLLF